MNSNDLFSFLDEAPPEIDETETHDAMDTDDHHEVPRKRKVDEDGPATSRTNGTQVHANGDNEAGPSEPKKLRMASPAPMVTDEVEIAAKREVAASAGLQGSIEAGSRLELRHQVCTGFRTFAFVCILTCYRSVIKSQHLLVTPTFLSPIMYLQRNQPENINSRWTPSSKCQYMRFSATRVCWCLHIQVLVRLL